MDPDDPVDWTIRNQRVRGPVGWAWLLGWGAVWFAGAIVAERLTPMQWRAVADIVVLLLILMSFIALIVHVERHPRIRRLKLGEQLVAVPRRRLEPNDVRAIRLSPDPDEDYVESATPVALCQLTIEPRRGSPMRLVITTRDAARLRRWAERTGIPVDDPEGYSTPASRAPARPDACQADRGLRV
jgi:hypothetical protein